MRFHAVVSPAGDLVWCSRGLRKGAKIRSLWIQTNPDGAFGASGYVNLGVAVVSSADSSGLPFGLTDAVLVGDPASGKWARVSSGLQLIFPLDFVIEREGQVLKVGLLDGNLAADLAVSVQIEFDPG
jgi:hypothetical protein